MTSSLLPIDSVEMIFSKILLLKMSRTKHSRTLYANWNSAFEIHCGNPGGLNIQSKRIV